MDLTLVLILLIILGIIFSVVFRKKEEDKKNNNYSEEKNTADEQSSIKEIDVDYKSSTKEKTKEISTEPRYKDYPATETIIIILDFLIFIGLIIGVILFIYLIGNNLLELSLLSLLYTALGCFFLKLTSESIKILCDIAFYLKSINEKTK